jgi:hypothetical protein
MIFSTVPGMVVLGRCGGRAVSNFSAAVLADLAMRGCAISLVTLARVALSVFVLFFICSIRPHDTEIETEQAPFGRLRMFALKSAQTRFTI